jgi:DNA-binding transcriptional LysR family regulator
MARTTLRLCWLESFLAVVDNGGVEARAAEKLGFNASTVNRDIADLDSWLGLVTFNGELPRELTQDGLSFERTAREVVELLTKARRIPTIPRAQG